ncbi:hypothetical protein QE152_g9349 [Popillia japonica]|uniref:Uncharacterized protein n=1 Tax=Popillia japonica TaxID=7064 RepID=A0AAW1LZC2_POPJA
MREDRKRIRERLLQGISNNNPGEAKNFSEYFRHELKHRGGFRLVYPTMNGDHCYNFSEYFRHELKHRGGFRLVYPTMNGDHCYDKFFHQGQSSLYCDTASSKARESAQAALRDEMQLKAKLEASKRVPMLKPPTKAKSEINNQVPSLKRPAQTLPSFILNSFEPQMIVESEEKERLLKLSSRK